MVGGNVRQGVARANVAEEVGIGNVGVEFTCQPRVHKFKRDREVRANRQIGTRREFQPADSCGITVEGVTYLAVDAGRGRALAEQVVVVA